MLINLIFLIIYVVSAGILSPEIMYYLLIVNCGICIVKDLEHKKIIITPILIFYIGVIVTNIANLIIVGKTAHNEANIYSYIKPRYIADGTQIWCISCSIIIIGYYLASRRKIPTIDYYLASEKTIRILFNILLFINVTNIIGNGINFRGGLVFRILGLLNTIGILFYARLWGATDSRKYRLYALTLFVLETYIALTTSYLRFELILPTIYLFTGYFIGKHDLKYLFSYRILPFVIIVVLFGSVFASLQKNRSNFISAFEESSGDEQEQEQDQGGGKGREKGLLLDRNANIAQLTNIVNLVKQNGFYDGRASSPLVIALVPRFLWPEKPKIEMGTWFALEIGAAYKAQSGHVNNSINMTIPGELYLDFGWFGVVFGSLLMGAFMSLLWNSTLFYGSHYNITGIIFGGYLIYNSLLDFGADLQIVLTLTSTYLIFLVIKKIAKAI